MGSWEPNLEDASAPNHRDIPPTPVIGFLKLCMCDQGCVYVHMNTGASGGQRYQHSLELGLQVTERPVVSAGVECGPVNSMQS